MPTLISKTKYWIATNTIWSFAAAVGLSLLTSSGFASDFGYLVHRPGYQIRRNCKSAFQKAPFLTPTQRQLLRQTPNISTEELDAIAGKERKKSREILATLEGLIRRSYKSTADAVVEAEQDLFGTRTIYFTLARPTLGFPQFEFDPAIDETFEDNGKTILVLKNRNTKAIEKLVAITPGPPGAGQDIISVVTATSDDERVEKPSLQFDVSAAFRLYDGSPGNPLFDGPIDPAEDFRLPIERHHPNLHLPERRHPETMIFELGRLASDGRAKMVTTQLLNSLKGSLETVLDQNPDRAAILYAEVFDPRQATNYADRYGFDIVVRPEDWPQVQTEILASGAQVQWNSYIRRVDLRQLFRRIHSPVKALNTAIQSANSLFSDED